MTTPEVLDATDQWFVRAGLPHAKRDYSAREDVLTRAWPFLLFVLFVELFATFGDRFEGWAQAAAFVGGVALLAGAFVIVNLLRRRPPRRLPDDIGVGELAVYLFVPALLPLWFNDGGWAGAIAIVLVNLAVLALAYAVTSYGLMPAIRVGLGQAVEQIRTVTQLVARGLPMLLLITAFVFLNAEMWQVAHDFPPIFYAICVGAIVVLSLGFLALRVPREVAGLARFESWESCCALAGDTTAPIASDLPVLEGRPPDPELERVEVINVGLLLTISQVVQTLLIGVIVGCFYVAFGLFAVRERTVLQWTTAGEIDPILTVGLFGDDVVLTWEHLAVAGFIAAFSVLQFAVASVTDSTYREEFYDDVATDVRGVLAVRAIVRAVNGSDQ